MRFPLLAVLLMLLPVAAGAEAVRVPEGWSSRTEEGNLAVVSPADAQGQRVTFVLRPAEAVSGNAEPWFRRTVAALVVSHRLLLNGRLERDGSLLKIGHVVRTKEGAEISFNAYAYAAGEGRQQLILLIYPHALDATDPRVGLALGEILGMWRRAYAYGGPEAERKPDLGPHGIVPRGFGGTEPGPPSPIPPSQSQGLEPQPVPPPQIKD